MTKRRLVVLETLAGNPYAGMAWMHMQIAAGLHRLRHDIHYSRRRHVALRAGSAVNGVCPLTASLASRESQRVSGWAPAGRIAGSSRPKEWLGMSRGRAEEFLRTADVVFNVTGTTRSKEEASDVLYTLARIQA